MWDCMRWRDVYVVVWGIGFFVCLRVDNVVNGVFKLVCCVEGDFFGWVVDISGYESDDKENRYRD